jgi:hypothetical protein
LTYLKGRIQTNNLQLTQIIFSAFYRYLLIYFMNLLYTAGAVTEAEINKLEAQITRKQLGLQGDVKNDNILKIMSFYARSTCSIISEDDSTLRR